MHARHAFTIPEMLVVIAIVGLLAALAISLGGHAREKSRRSGCIDHLRQIALAGEAYAGEYNANGRLPCGKSSVFANVAIMSNRLGTAWVLVCPSSIKRPTLSFSDSNASDAANVSYTQQTGQSTGMVWQANINEVLFWDQGVAGNPCGPTGSIGLSWARTSNHKTAGGNVLFNDGHVRFLTKTPTNMPLGCLNP